MITKSRINLVAANKRPVRAGKQPDKLYVMINLFIFILLIAILTTALIMNANAGKLIEQGNALKSRIAAAESKIAAGIEDRKMLNKLTEYRKDMEEALLQISLSPELSEELFLFVWEKSVNVELSAFHVDGGVLGFDAKSESELNILEYVDALKVSPFFASVGFNGSIKKADGIYFSRIVTRVALADFGGNTP